MAGQSIYKFAYSTTAQQQYHVVQMGLGQVRSDLGLGRRASWAMHGIGARLFWLGQLGGAWYWCMAVHTQNTIATCTTPGTKPCTTHAMMPCTARLARHHIPNPTPPNTGPLGLHDTAAASIDFKFIFGLFAICIRELNYVYFKFSLLQFFGLLKH